MDVFIFIVLTKNQVFFIHNGPSEAFSSQKYMSKKPLIHILIHIVHVVLTL